MSFSLVLFFLSNSPPPNHLLTTIWRIQTWIIYIVALWTWFCHMCGNSYFWYIKVWASNSKWRFRNCGPSGNIFYIAQYPCMCCWFFILFCSGGFQNYRYNFFFFFNSLSGWWNISLEFITPTTGSCYW